MIDIQKKKPFIRNMWIMQKNKAMVCMQQCLSSLYDAIAVYSIKSKINAFTNIEGRDIFQ